MTDCQRFIVSGRVQGVGFRAAACERAQQLGLSGWVTNRRDGRVELIAAGAADRLDALRQWLHHGPSSAHVEAVEQTPTTAAELPGTFVVR